MSQCSRIFFPPAVVVPTSFKRVETPVYFSYLSVDDLAAPT